MKTRLGMLIAPLIIFAAFSVSVYADTTQPSPSITTSSNVMQRYIATNRVPAGPPFYTNNTPGAVHMMKASNSYFYSYVGSSWNIFRSTNLTSWTLLPEKATPIGTWGKDDFWVPEVVEHQGKFYMFYCARSRYGAPSQRIGLAIADRPEGPFKDIGHPLFNGSSIENWYVIDPNPFIDPDTGEKYLFFVYLDPNNLYIEDLRASMPSSRIYGIRLADDLQSVVGEPTLLVKPSQSWEYTSYTRDGKRRLWMEAPEVLKTNGMYYIMYSTNAYTTDSYNVGYAASSHPLGPYVKFDLNPVIGSIDPPQKAGHNSVVRSLDGSEYFTAYQATNDARFLSRVGTRSDGTLYVNGPMRGPQIMPGGTADYVNHAKQAKVTVSSTRTGYQTAAIADGEIGIYARLERYEWASDNEAAGAWVRLAWDQPVITEYVMLHDSALPARMVKTGRVMLNDDPNQVVTDIKFPDGPGEAAILRFPELKELHSLTFIVDEMSTPGGTAGMSEIAVLGRPEGYVWLASPQQNAIVAGSIPIELKGLLTPVTQVDVTLAPVSLEAGTEATPTAQQVYSGSELPKQLVFNTRQVEDGAYDLNYSFTTVEVKPTTLKQRIIVRNWETLEDPVQPPTTGWFGEVQHIKTVAASAGWEFVGDTNDTLFGDIDRIRRKADTDEWLTWNLPRLQTFAFTLYAKDAAAANNLQVVVSADGQVWLPVPGSLACAEQAAGWQKLLLTGTVTINDAAYIRLTFTRSNLQSSNMQLGHVVLRGYTDTQL